MTTVVTFRADSVLEAALEALMADGADRTSVIRDAVLAAARAKVDDAVRAEALLLAGDEQDRTEAQRILVEMESARAR
jgi:hypothetical protein